MLVLSCDVGQSLLIEDVQLLLIYADPRSIIFSMQKLAGGRETKVSLQRHQIVNVCYNVSFQLMSVSGQSANLVLEHPEEVTVQKNELDPPSN
ncbi:hypothetical protein KOR42_15250 [Thalassoglobus neptunius]|uniref:Uncharacterized protein n=1 Tax=Thalassoglobus neptunius TaxID=1938619 RepID=A0A5C5X5F2_9PLAN|nr:hypothetical protein [Thalassoglobus neptunius]TWT58154.1 hypothetical protein KOR42_15250 [Thalassoglobus neptunius]